MVLYADDGVRHCNNLRFATEHRMLTYGMDELEAQKVTLKLCPRDDSPSSRFWGETIQPYCLEPGI